MQASKFMSVARYPGVGARSSASVEWERGKVGGLTLIGLLGVMAVLTILAAVLVPSAIRKLDQIAGDKEVAMLKSLSVALERSIMRRRVIPAHADWAQVVAAELGVNVAAVTENLRRQPRVLLIDPGFVVGNDDYEYGEEYAQDDNRGSVLIRVDEHDRLRVVGPQNARMIIVSSISTPLPAAIANWEPNGSWTTADFDGIWNWNDAGNVAPAGAAWAGWSGAADLKVERLNLAGLFVKLSLSKDPDSTESAAAALDPATEDLGERDFVEVGDPWEAYYIRGSVVCLYGPVNVLQARHILSREIGFIHQDNVWRSDLGGPRLPSGLMDLGTVVERFLRATGNPNSQAGQSGYDPKLQQQQVVQSFRDYIQAYLAWEEGGFSDSSLASLARSKQAAMMNRVQELYYNPTYTPPEVPCPE
jgi:hypothetical protein